MADRDRARRLAVQEAQHRSEVVANKKSAGHRESLDRKSPQRPALKTLKETKFVQTPIESNSGIEAAADLHLINGCTATVSASDFDRVSATRWTSVPDGYVVSQVRGKKTIYLHRVIMGAPLDLVVDHVDGNPLNNVRSNLRICTKGQNLRCRRQRRDSSSPYKGIWKTPRGRWNAAVTCLGKKFWLGVYDNPADAARAYDAGARLHFGEFAALNFPLGGEVSALRRGGC